MPSSTPSGPTRRPAAGSRPSGPRRTPQRARPQAVAPAVAAGQPAPPDDPARDRRLRVIVWVLVAAAMLVLVARTLLVAAGAPAWVSAPLSFWTVLIVAIFVQGWRARSRIRRSVAFVAGMATAVAASATGSLVAGLAPDASWSGGLGRDLTLGSVVLAVATMLWAGPPRPSEP
ncbi:MAG: hypothetical protein U0Q15_01350 [Kineosporiaceae bacterium]